ncbi:MAG TPA: hypothetical protein VLJ14_02875 [Ktedonobacterales bacterium]|nr:hypothetical protein [Ktedonobacterales bacterium]
MRKRIWIAAGAGGIFVVGLLAGMLSSGGLPVFAANNTPRQAHQAQATKSDYCQLYEDTLAQQLGKTNAQLEAANKVAVQKVIDQLVADGKITAAQKTRLENALNQNASNPCQAIGKFIAGHGPRGGAGAGAGAFGAALTGARQDILNAVAGALHMPLADLQTALTGGKTVAQIASDQKVDVSAVQSAYIAAVKADLAKAVSAGQITRQQSDMALSAVQQAVNAGHYPLLDDGRHGGFGHP